MESEKSVRGVCLLLLHHARRRKVVEGSKVLYGRSEED